MFSYNQLTLCYAEEAPPSSGSTRKKKNVTNLARRQHNVGSVSIGGSSGLSHCNALG